MAREPFVADDLGAISLVLDHFPMAGDLVRLVRRIEQAAAYPITSCVALEELLGGDDATLRFAGRDWPVPTLRRVIPAYYFPIASSADLAAKLTELARQRCHGGGMGKEHGKHWAPGMPPGEMMIKRRMFGPWGPRRHGEEPPWARRWHDDRPGHAGPPTEPPGREP